MVASIGVCRDNRIAEAGFSIGGMTSVLLAEAAPSISEPLARALRREGYEVGVSADGPGTFEVAKAGGIDLIVLDIGLPRVDGLEVCRRLRLAGHVTPVLILTPRPPQFSTLHTPAPTTPPPRPTPSPLALLLA